MTFSNNFSHGVLNPNENKNLTYLVSNHFFTLSILVAKTSLNAQIATFFGSRGNAILLKSNDLFPTIVTSPADTHPFPKSIYSGTGITKLSGTPDCVILPLKIAFPSALLIL